MLFEATWRIPINILLRVDREIEKELSPNTEFNIVSHAISFTYGLKGGGHSHGLPRPSVEGISTSHV